MTMLEKMARAIHAYDKAQDECAPDWERVNQPYYLEAARAALLEIREPREAVVVAGDEAIFDAPGASEYVFTAMIDAILNEKPDPT